MLLASLSSVTNITYFLASSRIAAIENNLQDHSTLLLHQQLS